MKIRQTHKKNEIFLLPQKIQLNFAIEIKDN
jgi:hypothetical protein